MDVTLDASATTSELHIVSPDATSADDFCVDALPHTSHYRDSEQFQTLRTSSGFPGGRATLEEHVDTRTRQLAIKQTQRAQASSSDFRCPDTDTEKNRLITSLAELDKCIRCLLLRARTSSVD